MVNVSRANTDVLKYKGHVANIAEDATCLVPTISDQEVTPGARPTRLKFPLSKVQLSTWNYKYWKDTTVELTVVFLSIYIYLYIRTKDFVMPYYTFY